MMSKKELVIKQIETTLEFLKPFLNLANIHMVDYLVKDGFVNYLPIKFRKEIINNGIEKTVSEIYTGNTENLENLHNYIETSRKLTLKNIPSSICVSLEEFKNKLQNFGCTEIEDFKMDIFMKPKKSHEVELLSGIVAAIYKISQTTHLIDIGDGKGYLSSILALNYKIPVLGIDASQINTNGAVNRAQKLSKRWNGCINNNAAAKTKETNNIELYKPVTKFVETDMDIKELISNIFIEKSEKIIGLVGLHTCGNLAATSLKIFNESKDVKTISNVGCCYNHLNEDEDQNNTIRGFPLSNSLKETKFSLGRNARMLAAQSVERIFHFKEKPNRTIFFRAIFQLIIEKNSNKSNLESTQVGRFKKPCLNFLDYVKKASKKINMNLEISDEEIMEIYSQYDMHEDELIIFYLIRARLAPVIESIILLDRLLYLLENEHENSFIVQLFDPVVSPRCYGIISIKN